MKMNLIVGIVFGLFIFFSLSTGVKASPWGIPECGSSYFNDVIGLCCNHDCQIGERACDKSGNYMISCGDYDSWFDFDQCYEWSPEDKSYWHYCSYGCRNAICWQTNPCDIGDACIEGTTRCGGTTIRGVSVEAVFPCKYNEDMGCWLWSPEPIQVCEPPLYSECGSGACVTYEQGQESECSKRQSKCASDFIVGCEDPNMDNVWTWETNPDDWYPCEFGCTEKNGRGQCMDQKGDTPGIDCISGSTRCNPGYPDYIQVCGLDSEWIIDPDPDPNRYCEFGCHLGFCNREPDPEIECYNCTLGDTRCAGAGDYVRECAFDVLTGCNAWIKSYPCDSGRCENGVCVERGQHGFITDISEINDTIHGITHDNRYVYVFGREWEDRFLNYSVYRLTYDLQIVDKFNISGYEDILYTDLSYDGNNLWASRRVNVSHFQLTQFDSDGTLINNYYVFVNTSGGFSGFSKWGGIAIDDTFIYLGSHSNSLNDDRSIVTYYRTNMTNSSITLCTLGNPNDPDSDCEYNQFFDSLLYNNGKIYIFSRSLSGLGGGSFSTRNWQNTKVEIYGTDGFYYGTFNVTDMPNVANNEYVGIDYIDNKFYFLHPNRKDPENSNLPTPRIEVRYDFTVCDNECFDESSKCGGIGNNYIIPCVQDSYDCWKWYQGDWMCTLLTCDVTQCQYGCEERWENHRIKKAYCKSASGCQDICEPNEVACSEDGKYVKECEYRYVWQNYENSIIPVGGQCWTWEDSIDWEFCGFGECINGHCVQADKCTENETDCFIYPLTDSNPDLRGTEHLITCRDINNDGFYEWDTNNMTLCYWGCNVTIVNSTTNQSIASCINQSGDFINLKNTITESSVWMGIMFPDPISKYMLVLVINIIIFIILTVYGQWEFGLLGISMVTILTSLIGWMPFEVIILGIVFSGIFIYTKISGGV